MMSSKLLKSHGSQSRFAAFVDRTFTRLENWYARRLKGSLDYRAVNVRREIKPLVPNGIDIIWDNVGGALFDGLLPRIAMHARVVVCGAISIYSDSTLPPGPSNYMQLVFRRAKMEGLIVLDHEAEYPWARERLATWIREGKIKHAEDVVHGLENAPQTLLRLFTGENFGKQVLTLR